MSRSWTRGAKPDRRYRQVRHPELVSGSIVPLARSRGVQYRAPKQVSPELKQELGDDRIEADVAAGRLPEVRDDEQNQGKDLPDRGDGCRPRDDGRPSRSRQHRQANPARVRLDEACLAPAPALSPDEIRAIREAQQVSQPVFARYLNVSKNPVSDWERGAKKPRGPALRLLSIIRRNGLDAVA